MNAPASSPTNPAGSKNRGEEKPALIARDWVRTAIVAGAFCILVCAGMMFFHARSHREDPLKAIHLTALKETLRATPEDERLKEQIRALDLQVRRQYFHQLALIATGSWLALGGLALFLLAAKQVAAIHHPIPLPQPKPHPGDAATREAQRVRWSVAAVGGLACVSFLALAWTAKTSLPARWSDLEESSAHAHPKEGSQAGEAFSDAELRLQWPRFRGADGNGVSIHTNLPLACDAKTGSGLRWKTAVPAPGYNSPIVWDHRVYLSGGDKSKQEIFCFNAESGELVWRRAVQAPQNKAAEEWEVPELGGMAPATMATDGRRVYAIFSNGNLAALDMNGNPVWSKNLGLPHNAYGHSTSLLIWQNRLIVQMDQGESEERKSKLYAFDTATGQVIWQQVRPVAASWATPIVIEAAGKPQIITLAVPWVIAYAAGDGIELWRAECLDGEITPSPIYDAGLVIVVKPNQNLLAIRPDGAGDVTKTHVAWSADENVPDIASPVSDGELVFTLSTTGVLTCYEAKSGAKQWEQDFRLEFKASPTRAGHRLYLVGAKGEIIVVEASRAFKELARGALDDEINASPAFAHNRIFIRGAQTLYCLGAPEGKLAKQ